MTAHKLQVAKEMYAPKQHTVAAIAKTLGVSRVSIYRHPARRRLISAPAPCRAAPTTFAAIPASRPLAAMFLSAPGRPG